MITLYTKDVYAIEEDTYSRDELLQFFLDGNRNVYISVYKNGCLIKIIGYLDVLYNREVPEKVLVHNKDVFEEARKIFFTYENRQNRAIPVVYENGEIAYILCYKPNKSNYAFPVSEYMTYCISADDPDMDIDLFERTDVFCFEELEEYTYAIADFILKKYPQKYIVFRDENAEMFFKVNEHFCIARSFYDMPDIMRGHSSNMYINSRVEHTDMPDQPIKKEYKSIELLTALLWKSDIKHLGENNPDKTYMLIRFPLYASGLADVIKFVLTKLALIDDKGLELIPVVDLSIPDVRNQFSRGTDDNVWEYYFEPLNKEIPEDIRCSKNVLVMDNKISAFNPYLMEQLYNRKHMCNAAKKYLKLNSETKEYLNKKRKELFASAGIQDIKNIRIIGVVARGTDYRSNKYGVPVPMEDNEYIELVKYNMELWNCGYILLATEDLEVYQKFMDGGIDKNQILSVSQERYDYSIEENKNKLVSDVKPKEHNYKDELPYLSTMVLLSECTCLMSNCKCGAYQVADYINADKYEHIYCYESK